MRVAPAGWAASSAAAPTALMAAAPGTWRGVAGHDASGVGGRKKFEWWEKGCDVMGEGV